MISFIIPAHNEEDLLPRTLGAIHTAARAAGVAYEIVVTDDASTDATAGVAQRHGARVVSIDRRQIAAARNAGARVSRGEYLFFVDADTALPAATLAEALRAMDAGAVGGVSSVRFDGVIPLYARIVLGLTLVMFRALRVGGGCFVFCRRDAFEKTGGWDETVFAGEEMTMCRELHRVGGWSRFIVLRRAVVTSGRKLRTHSAGEIFGTLGKLALSGGRAVRRREGLDIWYAPRRRDPGEATGYRLQATGSNNR